MQFSRPATALAFSLSACMYVTEAQTGEVRGHIYSDINGDFQQNPGEPNLSGVEVVISESDGNEFSLTTDGNGDYVGSVPEGETTVWIAESTLPRSCSFQHREGASGPNFSQTFNVGAGEVVDIVDGFQFYGEINGHFYVDSNGNSQEDGGEPGLSGLVCNIEESDGNEFEANPTDGSGNLKACVPPGETRVRCFPDDDLQQTQGSNPQVLDVKSADTVSFVSGFAPRVDDTPQPTPAPTTKVPTHVPATEEPTKAPTPGPEPTNVPTNAATPAPEPTKEPTAVPASGFPTGTPTAVPTSAPTPQTPVSAPTEAPPPTTKPDSSTNPTQSPALGPSPVPTSNPGASGAPSTGAFSPTATPIPSSVSTSSGFPLSSSVPSSSVFPSAVPSLMPSSEPSTLGSSSPSLRPSFTPSTSSSETGGSSGARGFQSYVFVAVAVLPILINVL